MKKRFCRIISALLVLLLLFLAWGCKGNADDPAQSTQEVFELSEYELSDQLIYELSVKQSSFLLLSSGDRTFSRVSVDEVACSQFSPDWLNSKLLYSNEETFAALERFLNTPVSLRWVSEPYVAEKGTNRRTILICSDLNQVRVVITVWENGVLQLRDEHGNLFLSDSEAVIYEDVVLH